MSMTEKVLVTGLNLPMLLAMRGIKFLTRQRASVLFLEADINQSMLFTTTCQHASQAFKVQTQRPLEREYSRQLVVSTVLSMQLSSQCNLLIQPPCNPCGQARCSQDGNLEDPLPVARSPLLDT